MFFGRAVIAEFADTDAGVALFVRGTERRTKDAAGHGAGGVEIAEAGGGVERGTNFVVGEVFEEIGAGFVEGAGAGIAGKGRSEAGDGVFGARADGVGALRIGGVKRGEAVAEARGIELRDGEDTGAALGASGGAEKPGAGAAGGVGNGGIDDLHELSIARGEHKLRIEES